MSSEYERYINKVIIIIIIIIIIIWDLRWSNAFWLKGPSTYYTCHLQMYN